MNNSIVYDDPTYRMYRNGTEEVSFSEAELAVMATDPAFGYVRRCGHPTTIRNGELISDDCMICEYEHEAAYYAELDAAELAAR